MIRPFAVLTVLLAGAAAVRAGDALERALASHQYADALQLLQPMLQAQPANPRLLTLQGVLLTQLHRVPESLASFEEALRISAKYLPALEGATEAAYHMGDARAAGFAGRVLALEPGNATAHGIVAALAFEAGDCATAIPHFEKARAAIARNSVARAQFGQCLVATGRHAAAVVVLSELVRLKPDNSEVWNLLAQAHIGAGQVSDAIAALRKAIEIAPADERNYLDLGYIALQHSSYDTGIEVINAGLRNITDSARLYTMRGVLCAESGRVEEAQQDFETAQRSQPHEHFGPAGLSVLMAQTQRLPEAVALLKENLRRAPEDPQLNYLLADTLIRQGTEPGQPAFAEARQALERAIRADPKFARAHSALGKVHLKSGETGRAIEQFHAALENDPADRVALYQLMIALNRSGRTQEAAAAARQLKNTIEQERQQEVERNRIRLTIAK